MFHRAGRSGGLLRGGGRGLLRARGGRALRNGGGVPGSAAATGGGLFLGGLTPPASGHFVPGLALRGVLVRGGLLGFTATAGLGVRPRLLRPVFLGLAAPALGRSLLRGRFLRPLVRRVRLGGSSRLLFHGLPRRLVAFGDKLTDFFKVHYYLAIFAQGGRLRVFRLGRGSLAGGLLFRFCHSGLPGGGLRRFRHFRLRGGGLGRGIHGGLFRDLGLGGIDFLRAAVHFFLCHSIPPSFFDFWSVAQIFARKFYTCFF